MKRTLLTVIFAGLAIAGTAHAQSLDLAYSLTSPLADATGDPADPASAPYEADVSGLAVSLGFGAAPILAGELTYTLHGFYRTADSPSTPFTEASIGVGVRTSVARLGGVRVELGGLAAYSRFWWDPMGDGAKKLGGGYWVAPEARATLPFGDRFSALGLVRALLYLDRPGLNNLEFPFESGIVVSVGGSYRF